MNLLTLQTVAPIKLEEDGVADSSVTSLQSHCSYFNINEWGGSDVVDGPNLFVTSSRNTMSRRNTESTSTPHKSVETRKILFSLETPSISGGKGKNNLKSQDNANSGSNNDHHQAVNMQKDDKDFATDVWNFSRDEISQPLHSFSESTNEYQNTLRVDVISRFQEFTTNVDPPIQNNDVLLAQSSGYPCTSYQSNNGIMRTYSNELNQQISQQHQTSMAGMNNHPMGIHMGYQATSPNAGDATNSSHNSPFTSSPPQGFEYPTSPHVKPSIPPNTDYPGDYNFSINFGETTESAPKSAQYTYSYSLNKLFVKMNVTCPIRFKCDSAPPMGCSIRAIPVFKRPEHVTDIVTRCPNHKIPDEANFLQCGHLIRAEMPDELVRYNVANDMRESVSVRYERPQIGAEYTTVLYKFMCLSSCVGGINRRPLLTVFILETPEGQVLGRRVVEVRICSCPGRDRAQEEKRKFSDGSGTTSNGRDKNLKRSFKNMQTTMEINQTLNGKKRRAGPSTADQEEYILKIRGRDKFLMLKRVKEALDLMEYVTPQQQEAYRNKEDQDQAFFRQQLSTDSSARINPQCQDDKDPSSTNNPGPISSVFTVSNPLTSEAASSAIEGLMSPSHSRHPLTVTPTGVVTLPGEDSVSTSFSEHPTNSQHYWTVDGSQLGCDIPDTTDPLRSTPSTSKWTPTPTLQTPLSSNPQCISLSREPSGASTVSASSGSISTSTSSDDTVSGRYVTRVLLRQTVSLNRDPKDWDDIIAKDQEPDDFSWDNMVKMEKMDGSHLDDEQPH